MTTINLNYSTSKQLAEIIGIKEDIPSWNFETEPTKEEVGQGDDSKTIFYLAQKSVIRGTQILYYGSTQTTTDQLIETTDYVLDLDTGKITLTTAGVTKVSTNKIFAEYSFIINSMTNTYLETVLERAEVEVDGSVNSTFADGTETNPSYSTITEIQESPGYFLDRVIVKQKPLIDITSNLNGALDDSQETIDLTAGTGTNFPTSGYLIIESEVISYTGITTDQLTGVTRGEFGTTAIAHDGGLIVHSTIFFKSNTVEGTLATFIVQPWDSNVYITEEGLAYSFDDYSAERMTTQDVANRVKIIYYTGYDTIPADITRLTLLFAKRQLMQDTISKSLIAGRDEFNPEMFNADMNEIKRIINNYIILPMGNT